MGEMTVLIQDIKSGNQDDFMVIVEKFQPLIKKYVNLLYKDEKEDSTSELILAIWEAILKMDYCDSDGQATVYICNAIKNRYYELYRSSRRKHDYELNLQEDTSMDEVYRQDAYRMIQEDTTYGDVRVKEDIRRFLTEFSGLKLELYKGILVENLTDKEVAKKYNISRQYVNRIRRDLKNRMIVFYFNNEERPMKKDQ